MSTNDFHPLANRLIRSIFIGATLCALVIGGVVLALTYRQTQQSFEQALQDIGRSNLPMLSVVIWDIEPEAIRRQLEAITLRPEIGAVRLRVKTGQRFEAGTVALLATHTVRRFDVPAPNRADLAIAELDIVAAPAAVLHEVLMHMAGALLGMALLTLVVCLLIVYLLRRDLEKPLRHIAQFARELTPAQLTRPLVLDRPERRHHDEIDLVAEGFRALQNGIRGHIASLDSQVAERTRELESALESIRQLSILDPLTGTFNRALFNERAPTEIERAERYGRPLSLIFVDLDHFKQVNDSLGHLVGDEVLRQTAERCRAGLRAQLDWAARIGGEEFVIVLPETPLAQALQVAERLRHEVGRPMCLSESRSVSITTSLGVAEYQSGESLQALVERADVQLYAAKTSGRNRVMPPMSG